MKDIIKIVNQALLSTKGRFPGGLQQQRSVEWRQARKIVYDIDKLYEKYPCLWELGRGYMTG